MNSSIVIQQPAAGASHLFLLFHGVGSNARDLLPVGQGIARQFPGAMVVSVDAPHASDLGAGRQWFSVVGVTEEGRPARIAQAMPLFLSTVGEWQQTAGVEPAQTTLVGFSQGAIMALESTQQATLPAHRVVAFAGRFATAPRQAPAGLTVHLIHGDQDNVISPRFSHEAAQALKALGGQVTHDSVPGLGHGIDGTAFGQMVTRLQG